MQDVLERQRLAGGDGDGSMEELVVGARRGAVDVATPEEIAPGVAFLRTIMVNVYFLGERGAGDRGWVLVDAGIGPQAAGQIAAAAAARYGEDARPVAVVLTHGHFDHVGGLRALAERWEVPVYAHPLELPYVTGRSKYPPMDPSVGGGMMALLSPLYPRGPIDLGWRAHALPDDGGVPGAPGWRWIHTPGHTAGHVSFVRDEDRTVIAGDAVITTKQESTLAVMTQRPEVRRPPAYATTDWWKARASIEAIADYEPELLATGHGLPMRGPGMRRELRALVAHFDEVGIPAHGRYVDRPAVADERGVVSVPPPVPTPALRVAAGLAIAVVAGATIAAILHRGSDEASA